jgi:hypothetical protein
MEFLKTDRFNTYSFRPHGDEINGRLLATFDTVGIAGGNFKIIFAAADVKSFAFSGAQLYLHPSLAAFQFIIEVRPKDIVFPHNLLSTPWEDLAARVAEKRVRIFNPSDVTTTEATYQSLLNSLKGVADVCFRWTVSTHDDLSFTLDLQGLPMSATAATRKPALMLDTAPALLLASHLIIFPSFPSELSIPGPTPVIFSDDPSRSEETLLHQLPLLRHEMARLGWQFSSREYLDLHTATTLTSSPREGHFRRPLCSALDHHTKPPASQDFLSTPTPMDPAAAGTKERNTFPLTGNILYRCPRNFGMPFI